MVDKITLFILARLTNMHKLIVSFIIGAVVGLLIGGTAFAASNLAKRLAGRILLQVESKGEAWYVDPVDLKRYYLGRPQDAFDLMRKKGLGISNKDIEQIPIATDWKIYNNTRYSYTINYPSNWYVDTTYSENDFTQRGPIENNDFIGGDTSFSNYPNVSSYNMENPVPPVPKDLYSVYLKIYQVASDISYDQFISSKYFEYDKKEDVSINGKSVVRLTSVTTDHPVGVTVVNTLVKVEDKMFVFSYNGNPVPQQEQDISNKIINSFIAK